MVELVDTHALGACALRRGGSSPSSRTRAWLGWSWIDERGCENGHKPGTRKVIEVTETSTEGLKHEFKVVVASTAIEERVDAKLGELASTISLPGFRPGKVPMSLLKKRYGSAVMGEVVEETVNEGAQQALTDQGLRPALQPKIEITKFEEGGELEYTLSVEVLPEIAPDDFSVIEVEQLKTQPTEEDVQMHLDRLAEAQTTFETEEDRKAEAGDAVIIDFVGRRDGTEFEGGSAKDFQLVLGSGSFIPGFEDQLIGAIAGQHLDVSVTFPESYGAEELAGQDAIFVVDVKEVKRPEKAIIDDELANKMGLDTLDELKKALTDQIKSDYDRVSRNRVKRKLLDELADRHDFEVPVGLVDAEFQSIWDQFGSQVANSEDDTDKSEKSEKSEDELRVDYKKIAERRVRLGLLLSEVGSRNNIEVHQEELNRAMADQARRYPGQEKEIIQHFQEDPQAMSQLQAPIFEDKVIDFILEMVNVTEREVTPDELLNESENDEAEAESNPRAKSNGKAGSGPKPKPKRKRTKASSKDKGKEPTA